MKDLETLFNSLIVSLFFYAIEVWGRAFQSKYLSRIDKFFKRAVRYGYTTKVLTINNIINDRDMKLWKSITDNSNHCLFDLLPPERTRQLRNRGHNYILPRIRTERFKPPRSVTRAAVLSTLSIAGESKAPSNVV